MPRLLRRKFQLRNWQAWLLGAPVVVVVVFLSYLMLRPDPAASYFYRAEKLQTAGQDDSALRLYSLIVSSMPDSTFAPLALQQKGEILTAMARRYGDASQYREAIDAYAQLATEYSSHSLAGEALLAAGSLAANDLRDSKTASGFYRMLLENYPANAEYVSEATLRLGRIALQAGDGEGAREQFTRVLQKHSKFPERCAEAQYHLGVAYETLIKNKPNARSAYEATIKKWPRSVWANDAKERLGMLLYTDGGTRPARRVLLQVETLPATGGDSRLAALKLLLAARGMEVSEAVLRGWSLTPFRAGFAPDNPARALTSSEDFATIAANAGLVYSRKTPDAARALPSLFDELDAGHAPFVSIDGWALVVGYDSSRDEISVQRPGGEYTRMKSKEFTAQWEKSKYQFLTFHAPGETLRAEPQPKPTPSSSDAAPELSAPLYVYKLPALSIKNAHQRVLRRAVALMNRPREDGVLLNTEALHTLAGEVQKLSVALPASPVPVGEQERDDEADTSGESTPDAAPTPAPTPAANISAARERRSKRWAQLRPWFGTPLKNWIEARRDSAAYLEAAATNLKDSRLLRAAQEFRTAMNHLQNAADTAPSADAFQSDAAAARAALGKLARELENARVAEKRATSLMQAAS